MAGNFRYTGKRLPVATASADITTGLLVVQEGFFGVALTSAKSGASLWIGTEGVWNIKVPSSTVKGDRLFTADYADAIDPTVTRTAPTGKKWVGTAVSDRDSSGYALVLLAPQGSDTLA
jgi:predicted RecA/RadA family phage recombinase